MDGYKYWQLKLEEVTLRRRQRGLLYLSSFFSALLPFLSPEASVKRLRSQLQKIPRQDQDARRNKLSELRKEEKWVSSLRRQEAARTRFRDHARAHTRIWVPPNRVIPRHTVSTRG